MIQFFTRILKFVQDIFLTLVYILKESFSILILFSLFSFIWIFSQSQQASEGSLLWKMVTFVIILFVGHLILMCILGSIVGENENEFKPEHLQTAQNIFYGLFNTLNLINSIFAPACVLGFIWMSFLPSESALWKIVPVLIILIWIHISISSLLLYVHTISQDWGQVQVIFCMVLLDLGLLGLTQNFDNDMWNYLRYIGQVEYKEILNFIILGFFIFLTFQYPKYPDLKYFTCFLLFMSIRFQLNSLILPSELPKDFAVLLDSRKDIQNYMTNIEGLSSDGTYINSTARRIHPAMFTWYYKNIDLVGHTSLGLTVLEPESNSQSYISHWPLRRFRTELKKDWFLGESSSLHNDVIQEGGYPDVVVIFKSAIDESRIVDWLKTNEEQDYQLFLKNCIRTVESALSAGGLPTIENWTTSITKRFYYIAPSTQVHAGKVIDALVFASVDGVVWFYMRADQVISEWVVIAFVVYIIILIFELFLYFRSSFGTGEFNCLEPKLKFLWRCVKNIYRGEKEKIKTR